MFPDGPGLQALHARDPALRAVLPCLQSLQPGMIPLCVIIFVQSPPAPCALHFVHAHGPSSVCPHGHYTSCMPMVQSSSVPCASHFVYAHEALEACTAHPDQSPGIRWLICITLCACPWCILSLSHVHYTACMPMVHPQSAPVHHTSCMPMVQSSSVAVHYTSPFEACTAHL